jgi:transcriptional regulator with XRE-family HTH domain
MTKGMERHMPHWTERSVDDFLYRIAADFITQLENKIQSEPLTKAELAQKLGVSKGRVSQIINNPGNLTLKMIIKCARCLGMKIAVVTYDDGDHENVRGPINSEIFRVCWENSGQPTDFWALEKPRWVASTRQLFRFPGTGRLEQPAGLTSQPAAPPKDMKTATTLRFVESNFSISWDETLPASVSSSNWSTLRPRGSGAVA